MLAHNLHGIDVHIEGVILNCSCVNATQYESFVTERQDTFHKYNKQMSDALAKWFSTYVSNTAASKFDWINIMSYDAYGTWSGPGDHSLSSMAVSDFQYWNTTKAMPAYKLTVGVPFLWIWLGHLCF